MKPKPLDVEAFAHLTAADLAAIAKSLANVMVQLERDPKLTTEQLAHAAGLAVCANCSDEETAIATVTRCWAAREEMMAKASHPVWRRQ